jgi:glycosyltransferase involved in cell wall biosynthesis
LDKRPIALVSGDFVPTGGMDMPNLALASYLARQGHRVHVVAHRVDPALQALPTVSFHRVTKPLRSYFLGAPLLDVTGRYVGRRVLSSGGRVVVNGGNCLVGDVNWVHYVHAAYEAPVAKGWRVAKALVERRLVLELERSALRSAKLVMANSKRTRRDLITRLGVMPERIHVVYFGTDERFRPPDEERRQALRERLGLAEGKPALAFVGALGDRRKGFDTLFEAWTTLGTDWDASLLVIGQGAELEAWKAKARQAGVDRSIKFLGFRSDVPDILRAVDGVVAPTRYEAFGQAVYEALCCGLPAIVSRDAGVAELIESADRAEPLLVEEPESVSELRARLAHWREHLASHREAALRRAKLLGARSWDTMAAEIAGLMGCAS